ncbi:hypothetical protein [Risungbinella massiliensis]|uniref:hypothetical protein n=1 Tax=Risungbinella massiliensis TaxID=1329796 RepID=UPI0005CB87F0|nr:hypothetical protein [Risungbinella massiliensis]
MIHLIEFYHLEDFIHGALLPDYFSVEATNREKDFLEYEVSVVHTIVDGQTTNIALRVTKQTKLAKSERDHIWINAIDDEGNALDHGICLNIGQEMEYANLRIKYYQDLFRQKKISIR